MTFTWKGPSVANDATTMYSPSTYTDKILLDNGDERTICRLRRAYKTTSHYDLILFILCIRVGRF